MTRVRLVAMWAMVVMNIIMVGIFGFVHPGTLEKILAGDFRVWFSVTPELLLRFSVINQIPIATFFLKVLLGY